MVDCQHDWHRMTDNEAYPAASGRVCKKCDRYQLGWFCDISEPGGEELNNKIVESILRGIENDWQLSGIIHPVSDE